MMGIIFHPTLNWVNFLPNPWRDFPFIQRACDENHDDGQELQETHPNQSVPGSRYTKKWFSLTA